MGLQLLGTSFAANVAPTSYIDAFLNPASGRSFSFSSIRQPHNARAVPRSHNSDSSVRQLFAYCCFVSSDGLSLKRRRVSHRWNAMVSFEVEQESALYDEFVEFATREVGQYAQLVSCPFQEEFEKVVAVDGKTTLCNRAFESFKIRLFRIATINGGDSMQVFNMAILPRPELDLPIFCADFFSTSTKHIIVLDLNPLYDAEKNTYYKQKYYSGLMPLVSKYIELLPWGQKLTTESLQFFSPLVIWTKLESRQEVREKVKLAFKDYLKAWLELMDKAELSTDSLEISENKRAQHRYLLWRATKDPGRPLLHRLFGEDWCEKYICDFLFNGVKSMGTEGFLDYFPEYKCADGTINKGRSMIGKSCHYRPWNKEGDFIGIC